MRRILGRPPRPTAAARCTAGRPTGFETLEGRWMLAGDSTVVFNEVMYHPAGDQELEWVELHNQMAVDMDLSGWRLDDGIEFEFPPGTVLAGGEYLVVAADPQRLQTQTGFAGAMGPYAGRLSNGGEQVELLDNNQRLMDVLDYRDGGDWPVGPDGSGASLAKLDPDSAGGPAENWHRSLQTGGTPGAVNFTSGPVLGPETSLLPIDATWWYDDSGTDQGTAWKEVGFSPGGAGWQSGGALLFDETAELPGPKTTPLAPGANTYYFRTEFLFDGDPNVARLTVQHVIDDGAVYYLNAAEIYRFNMPAGPVTYDTAATTAVRDATLAGPSPIDAGPLVQGPNVLAVEVHQAGEASLPGVTLIETGGGDGAGGVPDNLARQSRGAVAFAKDSLPGYPIHQIPHVNDGLYGNSNSWINNSAGSFAGVALDGAHAIDRIAFGRDNGGEPTQYTDRWGTYTLQYATVADPDAATPDAAWHDVATLAYGGGYPDDTPWLRHLWGFNPIEGVTGVRVITHENGICLDEIEVYSAEATDVVFGSTLDVTEILDPPELLFNEISASGAEPFWLEIVNPGPRPVGTGGLVIATSGGSQFALPGQSIPAGGMVSLQEAELGFAAWAGENLYLYGDDRSAVLDAVRVEDRLLGRSPQHDDGWLYPNMPTPGAANHFDFEHDVVINEIMYHPFEVQPGGTADEEWIELHNRGHEAADLTGWTLQDAVDFTFPVGTTLGPGQYLAVAKDAALLRTRYPDVEMIGDFARSLSNRDDRILLVDGAGNPADEVHYFDGGRWPQFADGGGSSLELRDPGADNSRPEAWADSDEGRRSSWNTYTYRGTALSDGGSTLYHEFVLGLLDAGELLLDNVSVVESPDGAAVQLIQNGTFDTATAEKWRILGNHRAEVVVDPTDPANRVLHLTATGASEDRLNHAETTLVNNRAIVNGREYEISFRAKWLGGSNQVNTRLYFNRLAATTRIDAAQLHGTPGEANSVGQANIGPTCDGLSHGPVIPDPGQPVMVSIRAEDPHGVAVMTLHYRVDGQPEQAVTMSHAGGGVYDGTIPGQAAASVVQFYVEGEDALGAGSFFPAAGPASRALYKVQDNRARDLPAHNFRVIMTSHDAALLHRRTNLMSNGRLGATVVYKESEVFYDVGVRLRGSNAGRANDPYVSFNVGFDPMHLFRGVHRSVAVDRSGRGSAVSLGQEEILVKHMLNSAGGVPGMYDDVVYLMAPKAIHDRPALLLMARYGDVFLDSQFPDGSDGTVFKLDIQYVPNGTTDGHPESLKLPYPYNHPPPKDLADYGDDQEAYRWHLLIRNNRAEDDYSRVVELSQAMSLGGSALAEAIEPLMDYDRWARLFAMQSLVNCVDTYFRSGLHHNVSFYVPPDDGKIDDGKILALFWDWDLGIFGNPSAPLLGNSSTFRKVVNLPGNLRVFHGHLLDLINTTFNRTYMDRWVSHYGTVAGQSFSPVLPYISARRSYVLNNLLPSVDFEVTTNGGQDFSVDQTAVTLEGTGWIDVREICLEGSAEPLEVDWINDRTWQVTLPLMRGDNLLTFQAFDFQGNSIGTDRVTVTSTAAERPLHEMLRITELHYNPAEPTPEERAEGFLDNNDFEFIELQNVGDRTLDLTGVRFTDGIDLEFTASSGQGNELLITEAGTAEPDFVEIQNVSGRTVDALGWIVAVNDPSVGINAWLSTLWELPSELSADEVLYRSDVDGGTGNFWGNNIPWRTTGPGWIVMLDAQGGVADFVVWGYTPQEIDSFDVTIDGHHLTADGIWQGDASQPNVNFRYSLQRSGQADHHDATDWAAVDPVSMGRQNAELMVPFPAAFELLPGQLAVVAGNAAALRTRYGHGLRVAGEYTGRLRNGGERVTLSDPFGGAIADFEYGDSGDAGWPDRADGRGASLEPIDPSALPPSGPRRTDFLGDGDNWRSSSEYGGSPGLMGSGPAVDVVVNEVLTNTPEPLIDAIELHNTSRAPVDVGGWYLSDSWGWDPTGADGNYRKFRIPDGTTVPAGGYVVFDEEDFNPSGGVAPDLHPNDFALNGDHGDDVWLMAADASGGLTRFVDHVEFGAAAEGEAWGRWPNGVGNPYPMIHPTLQKQLPENGANSGPRVGPLLISELHYHPDHLGADDLEFIEIYNPTAVAIDLEGWRIRQTVDFDFPADLTIAPRSTMVVVPFGPSDPDKLAAFRSEYSIGPVVPLIGGYTGLLDDDGGRVQLQRAGQPPADEPGYVPRLLEDEVIYGDRTPWPASPDGGGDSLHRLGSNRWGNQSEAWRSAPPSPGVTEMVTEVVARHVFYNNSAFDGNDPAIDAQDDAAIAPDKTALLPGQTATSANYTSYSRGCNGIMVDMAGSIGNLTLQDFEFRVGGSSDPTSWIGAPVPTSVSVRSNEGVDGSDRATIIWADNAIGKQWLQVTVLANANTGLAEPDVFYFGNAIGESGNSTADAKVNAVDMLAARDNQRSFLNPAPIDFFVDFNRDARVNAADMLIARNNTTHFLNALQLITAPSGKGDPQSTTALRQEPARDTVPGRAAGSSGRQNAPLGKLDWLYEYEPASLGDQPVEEENADGEAVDLLLADS